MNALVSLILIGAIGFVFSRFLFLRPRPGSWLDRFFISGVEFFLLGALIGPYGLNVIDYDTLMNLEPFVILTLSWVGLLFGAQLRWRAMQSFPASFYAVAMLQAGVALVVTAGLAALVLSLWNPLGADGPECWRAALCLGAVAAISSPSMAAVRHPRSGIGHPVGLLRFVPAIDPLIGLIGVALLFAIWHGSSPLAGLSVIGVLGISVAGGLLLGFVFLLLVLAADGSDELVLVVLGVATFAGGLAAIFQLSPLVVGVLIGFVLGNAETRQARVLGLLLRLERPLYIVLLVVAGAAWRFDLAWGYLLALLFLVVRVGSKFVGARVATSVVPLPFPVGANWWRGLLPQGAMAVAIGVSFLQAFRGPLAEIVFAAIIASTIVLSLISERLAGRALTDPESSP